MKKLIRPMIIARFLLAINLALLAACPCPPTVDPATRPPPIEVSPSLDTAPRPSPIEVSPSLDTAPRQVPIEGSPSFVKQVQRALDLLKTKSPHSYQMVNAYVGKIREATRSGILPFLDMPTLDLNQRSAGYSLTWCAGTIVHEAYHRMLYHSQVEAFGRPVPKVYGGSSAELKAIKYQVQVMKEIGAPTTETLFLEGQDGTHGDVDGDGVYTWKDYHLRDW